MPLAILLLTFAMHLILTFISYWVYHRYESSRGWGLMFCTFVFICARQMIRIISVETGWNPPWLHAMDNYGFPLIISTLLLVATLCILRFYRQFTVKQQEYHRRSLTCRLTNGNGHGLSERIGKNAETISA